MSNFTDLTADTTGAVTIEYDDSTIKYDQTDVSYDGVLYYENVDLINQTTNFTDLIGE